MERTGWYAINEHEVKCIIGSGEPIISAKIRNNSFNNYLHIITKFCVPDGKNLVVYKDKGILFTKTVPEGEPVSMVLKNVFDSLKFDLDISSKKVYFNLPTMLYVNRIFYIESFLNTIKILNVSLTRYGIEYSEYLNFVRKMTNKWNSENERGFGSHMTQLQKMIKICFLAKKYKGTSVRSKIRETINECGPKLGSYMRDFILEQQDIDEQFKDYFIKEFIIQFA